MTNKNLEIENILKSVQEENIEGFKIVDFWDSDETAIGLQFEKILLYISSYNFPNTKKYNIILENFDTGEMMEPEKSIDYLEVLTKIKELSERLKAMKK